MRFERSWKREEREVAAREGAGDGAMSNVWKEKKILFIRTCNIKYNVFSSILIVSSYEVKSSPVSTRK